MIFSFSAKSGQNFCRDISLKTWQNRKKRDRVKIEEKKEIVNYRGEVIKIKNEILLFINRSELHTYSFQQHPLRCLSNEDKCVIQ